MIAVRPLSLFFAVLVSAGIVAQGPGSAGIHLDVLAADTSTYAAIADVLGAPGSLTGVPAGAPGNPYTAYTPSFRTIRFRLTVAQSILSPSPIGPGSLVSLLWSVGTPDIPLAAPPGTIPPANPGPWIISVLPLGGSILDGLGILGPPSIFSPVDPGHPNKLEVSILFPFAPGPPVLVQAVILTPGGQLAISNGVSILVGPSPHETSLVSSMTSGANCPFAAQDEGGVPFPTPPGFSFFATPVGSAVARANGVIEFGPNANVECDYIPDPPGFGCSVPGPHSTPRIAVNFFDTDLNGVANPLFPPDLTWESVPATASMPSRTIIRYKHASSWQGPFGTPAAQWATSVCELWGGDGPFSGSANWSTIVVVRQQHHTVGNILPHGLLGIGPGVASSGFGGPPLVCTAIDFSALFGTPGYLTIPGEAVYLNLWGGLDASDSVLLSNLATSFRPAPFGSYSISVH